jgi:NAD(P)-dependent dehydrogenase (short-subunit alcohol dehydrogenase family)
MAEVPIAIVSGANRGLGLEVSRQLAHRGFGVVMGVRDLRKGEAAARSLGAALHPMVLDVADPESPARLAAEVRARFGRCDVLVNNAGIHYDTGNRAANPDWRVVREAFETNLFGAWRLAQSFLPLMRERGRGRIVNVSSEAGSLASMGAGTPAYSTSKAALNALTRVLRRGAGRHRHPGERGLPGLGGDGHGRRRGKANPRRRPRDRLGGHAPRRRPDRRILQGRPRAAVVSPSRSLRPKR